MCLHSLTTAEPLVAQEDITCYKFLKKRLKFDLNQITNGDEFTGEIKGIKCKGKITVKNDHRIYFCTNKAQLNGFACAEKHGFKYSWAMDPNVTHINLKKSGEILSNTMYVTPYQNTEVEIGKSYISELEINDDNDDDTLTIEQGLHSFQNLRAVLDSIGKKEIAVKCIIPKDAKYFIGKYHNLVSYASDSLTYVEIVHHEE